MNTKQNTQEEEKWYHKDTWYNKALGCLLGLVILGAFVGWIAFLINSFGS